MAKEKAGARGHWSTTNLELSRTINIKLPPTAAAQKNDAFFLLLKVVQTNELGLKRETFFTTHQKTCNDLTTIYAAAHKKAAVSTKGSEL